jgi:NADPH:quinone reductase-like Zn-dependent oxidoreductase
MMRVLEVRNRSASIRSSSPHVPTPAAGRRDVVVRLNALSLNYRGHLVIDGIDRWRPRGPGIPVSDGASVSVY